MIDRPEDEVMVVLPADPRSSEEDVFREVISVAHGRLANGAFDIEAPLVTLGVHLVASATDYGYLRSRTSIDGRHAMADLLRPQGFEEKPTAARAAQLLNEPGAAWNAGMFLWQRGAIRAAIEKYTPLMMLIGPAAASELPSPQRTSASIRSRSTMP